MPVAHGAAGRVRGERAQPERRRRQRRSSIPRSITDRRGVRRRAAPQQARRRALRGGDEARFAEFARGVAPILEGWVRMSNAEARRAELVRSAGEESP
jgi:hypothetical protein